MSRSTATPPVPPDLEDAVRAVGEPPRSALVRAGFLDAFRRLDLLRSADPGWSPPAGADRGSPPAGAEGGALPADAGRGPLHLLAPPGDGEEGDPVVVRPYRRGGLVRHVVEARYFLGDRAFHELALLIRLGRRGLPVPVPLAAVQRRLRPGYRAALATRLVPGVRPLSALLRDASPALAERLMRAAGATVGRLHAAGGRHADLNAHNLLADPGDQDRPVYLVDLDRGRLEDGPVPRRPARRSLRRLRRSLEKLSLEEALAYWDALEREYRRKRAGTAGPSAG